MSNFKIEKIGVSKCDLSFSRFLMQVYVTNCIIFKCVLKSYSLLEIISVPLFLVNWPFTNY